MRLTSAQQIPARVQRYADAQQLGTPRILYEAARASSLHVILGPCAFIVGCAIVGTYNLLYESVFSWWPVWQADLILYIGLAWLIVGAWVALTPLLLPTVRVYLCPKGLIYMRRRMYVIRWNQIEQLWKQTSINKKTHVAYAYTIRRKDGKQFHLKSDLPHLDRLGSFMEREIARQRLTQAIHDYLAGNEQQFGDVRLTREGIMLQREKRLLSWQDVASVSVDKATLSIYRKNDDWEWATLNIATIPNFSVLKGLVDHMLEETLVSRMPQILAYNAGFTVFFGKIGVNKTGVTINNGEEQFQWSDIASFGVGESEIIIRLKSRADQWYTLPAGMISDAPVLQNLVEYILREQK